MMIMYQYFAVLLISIFLCQQINLAWCTNDIEQKCEICRDLVKNFDKKLEQTASHGFGGGNTDWEESRLGKYSRSESRLIEILDEICEKVSKESICHAMVEKFETEIYDWWFKRTSETQELEQYLCIENSKVCCPKNTFGPECKDCPGGKEKPCNGHGTCQGSGTRKDDGKCQCDNGYSGEICDDCEDGFYDAGNSTCNECDNSCKGGCSGEGPKNCDDCKEGWTLDEETGCTDVDECKQNESLCKENEFCMNTVGSYECKGCHESCVLQCSGEGAKSCLECKEGYLRNETTGCEDIDECSANANCEDGQYCVNTIGSYRCEDCDASCERCLAPGSSGCIQCKEGFVMKATGCEDETMQSEEEKKIENHEEF